MLQISQVLCGSIAGFEFTLECFRGIDPVSIGLCSSREFPETVIDATKQSLHPLWIVRLAWIGQFKASSCYKLFPLGLRVIPQ